MRTGPKLPRSLGKSWTSLNDPSSFPMTFSTIDVERSFIRFLELGVRLGHVTKAMKETTLEDYEQLFLESLANDARLDGLDYESRKRVLDGWLRASVLKFENRGLNRKGGQRLAIPRPIHLGVIRAGLPSKYPYLIQHSDVWTYYSALRVLDESGVENPRRFLSELLRQRLGQGLALDTSQFDVDEPRYDEITPVDINALAAMRILSKFTSARPDDTPTNDGETWPSRPWSNFKRKNAKIPRGNAEAPVFDNSKNLVPIEHLVSSPKAFRDIGSDIVYLLSCYQELESLELTQHCLGLLSFRLYTSPLIAAKEVRELIAGRRHAAAMASSTPVEIYCDFSGGTDEASSQLARKCVARDLEIHRIFLQDRFYLRILDWLGDLQGGELRKKLVEARSIGKSNYFQALVDMRNDEAFMMAARLKLQEFQSAVSPSEDGTDGDDGTNGRWRELLSEWGEQGLDEVLQLTQILLGAHIPGGRAPAQVEQWCWTTGGMLNSLPHRPYALMTGSVAHRSTWRYAPTDQLLTSLLLGCFVTGNPATGSTVSEMRLMELLNVLSNKYGILVDRPPDEFDDADSLLAAERNRAHFARKLQLLGCFEGLSDDSQYQMVQRPR